MSANERRVLKWRKFQASKTVMPAQRAIGGQTVNVVGHRVFVIGSYPFGPYDEVCTYVYDSSRNEWTELTLPAAPTQRFGHICVLVDDKLFLFGGSTAKRTECALHVLDLPSLSWSARPVQGQPLSLFTSTAHFVEHLGKILLICGRIVGGLFSEHVYALDPDSKEWVKCNARGRSPKVGFHASCIAFNKVYVIGGVSSEGVGWERTELGGAVVHIFDFSLGLQRSVWSTVEVGGAVAPKTVGASLIYLGGGKILHMGGSSYEFVRDDELNNRRFLYMYDLSEKTASLIPYDPQAKLSCTGLGPNERKNFGFARWQNKLIIFGGFKETMEYLYELDTSALL